MVSLTSSRIGQARVREIIFLGTGTSGCIPNIPCITSNNQGCKVCKLSLTPEGCKNKRRNTSLLVRIDHPDGRIRNVVIDCGKTFLESAMDIFIKHDIKTIDAVLLTHDHADAMLGLDDLRQWTLSLGISIPIYCTQKTLDTISAAFDYLVDTSKATGTGCVPKLEFNIIDNLYSAFECQGVVFQPLCVEHGDDSDGSPYYFTGFRFENTSYISDCTKILDQTRPLIDGTELLILDSQMWECNPSHFGFWRALEEVKYYKPSKSLFVGFCHEIEHSEMEIEAKVFREREGLEVSPAYDGLIVKF